VASLSALTTYSNVTSITYCWHVSILTVTTEVSVNALILYTCFVDDKHHEKGRNYGPIAGCCEHCNRPSGSVKGGEFLN